MSSIGKYARGATWPLRRLLDPRFADVARRIEYANDRVIEESHQIEVRQDDLSALIGTFGAASNESLAFLGRQIREFEGALNEVTDRMRSLETTVEPVFGSWRIDAVIAAGIDRLDGDIARLLNFADGHRGFAAQRGLWSNPPVSLEYSKGNVRVGDVNERIVEIPYAFRALGGLPSDARILDVGSVESTIPLSLAGLGYQVTALDLRAYPYTHPNLEVVESRIEDFEREPGSYDAVLLISTIEHVGLGWYGEKPLESGADRRALERLGRMLTPGGRLVLTVPFGRGGIDELQRTYDDAMLDALLEGWQIESREIVRQHDRTTWAAGEVEDPDARAVAMVTALRPA